MSALHRYTGLDALRGVAAILVVTRHFASDFGVWQPALSYLAVDIFFILSGFVIAEAYDPRLNSGMTSREFMLRRFVRLLPLPFVGAVLSILLTATHADSGLSTENAVKALASHTLAIPIPGEESNLLFPYNSAMWSLFFELWVANAIYAFTPRKGIIWCAALASAGLIILILSQRAFHNIDTGWSWGNMGGGLGRVLFSFFLGVIISRSQLRKKLALHVRSELLLIATVIFLCLPVYGPVGQAAALAGIVVLFPALLVLMANSKDAYPRVSEFLGSASYPLYIIHLPIIHAVDALVGNRLQNEVWKIYLLEVGLIGGLCVLALLVEKHYDEPIRRKAALVLKKLYH